MKVKKTELNNGDITDHDIEQQRTIWESGLVNPDEITLDNIDKLDDMLDAMSLRFERTFS